MMLDVIQEFEVFTSITGNDQMFLKLRKDGRSLAAVWRMDCVENGHIGDAEIVKLMKS